MSDMGDSDNKPPAEGGVVEEIRGDVAVIEPIEGDDTFEVPMAELPEGIGVGDFWDGKKRGG